MRASPVLAPGYPHTEHCSRVTLRIPGDKAQQMRTQLSVLQLEEERAHETDRNLPSFAGLQLQQQGATSPLRAQTAASAEAAEQAGS